MCLLVHLLSGECISALWPSLTTKTLILYTLCGDFCTESRLACTYFQKALLHTSNKALQIALVKA